MDESGCSSPEVLNGVLVLFLLDVWTDFRACESISFFNNAEKSEFAEAHNVWQYYTVTN